MTLCSFRCQQLTSCSCLSLHAYSQWDFHDPISFAASHLRDTDLKLLHFPFCVNKRWNVNKMLWNVRNKIASAMPNSQYFFIMLHWRRWRQMKHKWSFSWCLNFFLFLFPSQFLLHLFVVFHSDTAVTFVLAGQWLQAAAAIAPNDQMVMNF